MKKLSILLVTAAALGTALPANADWDNIGQVRIEGRRDNARENIQMGGPVENLRLTARGETVRCRSVRAEFGNGREREIFRGTLFRDRPTNVDLPGGERNVRRLDFQCGTERHRDATIQISADIGRYRDEWRRHPDFNRLWSRVFNWGSDLTNQWQYLGSQLFAGRGDTEHHFAGWRGRRIDSLALKPVGADARCARVTAHFRNGRDRELDANRGDLMRQGQYFQLDVPGGYRNLESITLRCRPANARRVNIQIFTSH